VLGYLNLKVVATFLNIDITNFYLPVKILILEIGIAILVPLITSFIPIVRGTKISVAQALTAHESSKSKNNYLQKLINYFDFFPKPILLAFRNTFKKISRLALTLGTLTTAGILFISVLSVRSSLTADLESSLNVQNYDIILYLSDWYGVDELTKQAKLVTGVKDAEVQVNSSASVINNSAVPINLAITGIDPETDFIIPQITSGTWLSKESKNPLVLSSAAAKAHPEFQIGDTLTLEISEHEYDFNIIGIMVLTSGEGEDPLVYTNYKSLSNIIGQAGHANTLLVQQSENSRETQQDLVTLIEDSLKSRGFNTAATITTDTIKQSSEGQFNFLVGFLLSLAIMVAIVGGLGLSGTMSLNVLERTREIGILRGIGAGDNIIRQMVVFEGLTIGFLSFVLAVPLSLPVSYGFGAVIGLAFIQKPLVFRYSFFGVALWLLIVTVIAVLASLIPAQRASRMSVRDALSYE